MNQNLSSYWIFYTVANAGNISKAAKELYISQPAISKSIQKLEESLNCKLFSRSSRGVILTDEGNLLYGHVKDAFETLNIGEDKLKRSIELGVGRIQIGVSSTLCKYMLLPYLSEFIRQNPHISISISCQSTNETLHLLDENKIDIGLIGKPENFKGFQFDYLGDIEDTFVASPSYIENLAQRGIDEEEIIENATLMLLDKNNLTRKYIDAYFQDNLIDVSDTIDISDMGLLIDFAKQRDAKVIIRGLRAVTDFEYELQMAQTNRKLDSDIETIFLTTSLEYSYLSSSTVKEIASFGGDIEQFVPEFVVDKIKEKRSK